MHPSAETSIFTHRADALLERKDRAALIGILASGPMAGNLAPGLGGIRKLRFAPAGRGKSGGFRVACCFASVNRPVLALLVYAKNEQANITPQQHALGNAPGKALILGHTEPDLSHRATISRGQEQRSRLP